MSREATSVHKPNLYLLLDIAPGASHNEILHAYARAKMTYGSGSPAAYFVLDEEEKNSILEDVEHAFGILGNPAKRREYDLAMGFESSPSGALDPVAGSPGFEHEPVVIRDKKGSSSILEEIQKRASAPASATPEAGEEVRPSNVTPIRKVVEERKMPHYEPNPEFEEKIRACESVDGAFLRAVRIYRRMEVEELAQMCRLSPSHVSCLEDEDGASFHQPVYLRGHVLLVCRTLELPNPEKLARSYLDRMRAQGKIAKAPF